MATKQPANIESLRAEICQLSAERDQIASQKRSRAEIRSMVENQLTQRADTDRNHMLRQLAFAAAGQPFDVTRYQPFSIDPQALERALESVPEGMSPDERTARLDALSERLDTLELQEERLICASGGAISRRADARPEIVLRD